MQYNDWKFTSCIIIAVVTMSEERKSVLDIKSPDFDPNVALESEESLKEAEKDGQTHETIQKFQESVQQQTFNLPLEFFTTKHKENY